MYTLVLLALFHAQVERMDSDVWSERVAAHKAVEKAVLKDDIYAAHLRKIMKKHRSCEVQSRAARIMHKYYCMMPTNLMEVPAIDMIKDKKERRAALDKYIGDSWKGSSPKYEPMRYATYAYIYDKMSIEGWTRSKVRKFIEEMHQEEVDFYEKHPRNSHYPYGEGGYVYEADLRADR